jgi:hypothetical protein
MDNLAWNTIVRHGVPCLGNSPWDRHSAVYIHAVKDLHGAWMAEVMDPGFEFKESFRRLLRGTARIIRLVGDQLPDVFQPGFYVIFGGEALTGTRTWNDGRSGSRIPLLCLGCSELQAWRSLLV